MKWTRSYLVWMLSLAAIATLYGLAALEYTPTADIWFDDLDDVALHANFDGLALAHAAGEAIVAGRAIVERTPAARRDKPPRIVFLSVSDGVSPHHTVLGTGKGLVPALENAMAELRVRVTAEYRPEWVKLDVVDTVYPAARLEVLRPFGTVRSLEGLAFERNTRLALLPEELVANTLLNSDQELQPGNMTRYLEARPKQAAMFAARREAGPFQVFRFTTDSYFFDGTESFRLYRGHRVIDGIDPGVLGEAVRMGGDYLARSVDPDGRFVYTYLPKTDEEPDRYNILRHAGTAYSMLELYEVTNEPALIEAAERAMDYLLRSVAHCRIERVALPCIEENGEVKLGGNGLAAVALAKYIEKVTADGRQRLLLVELGRWIQSLQMETGEFSPHLQTYPDGEATDFVSRYYPGEALLALVRIYALEGDESLLDTAERGARFLIRVRDGNLSDAQLDHDHWLLYALNELYRYRANPIYRDHSLRIARAMIAAQNGGREYPDWAGGFGRPPASTRTATNSEGLCAAYQLARDHGEATEAQAILESLKNAIGFQLQTQFRPELAMYVHSPARVLGGFHATMTDFSIRIDYVQHNISSMLCADQVLR